MIRTSSSLSADPSHRISRDYGVLLEDEGIDLRGLFIIDPKGILRYALLFFILAQSSALIMLSAKLRSMTCQLVAQSRRLSVLSKPSSLPSVLHPRITALVFPN